MSEEIKDILNKFDKVLENYELDKKFKQFSVDSICHLFPNEMLTIKNTITYLQQKVEEKDKEIDRLNNIIAELEKYIGREWYCFDNESIEFKVARDILDKLKELKENK